MPDLTARIGQLLDGLASERGVETGRAAGEPPTLRPSDAGFAGAVAHLVGMPLDQYASEGAALEIRVPWCAESLWFVPGDADADRLGGEGVSRGRIWTALELSALLALPDLTPEIAQRLAEAKLAVDGDIVEVRQR